MTAERETTERVLGKQYKRSRATERIHVQKFVASMPESEWPYGVRCIGDGLSPHYDRKLYVYVRGHTVQQIRDGQLIIDGYVNNESVLEGWEPA